MASASCTFGSFSTSCWCQLNIRVVYCHHLLQFVLSTRFITMTISAIIILSSLILNHYISTTPPSDSNPPSPQQSSS